jgi:hypothetical protein
MDERNEGTHLQKLCGELTERDWVAHVRRRTDGPVLEVTNPHNTTRTTTVICRYAGGGPQYNIQDGQTLGPVTDVETAADQIQHVLRSVGR